MTKITHNNDSLAAVSITDGNDVLVLKYNLNGWGNLIIATGNSATETSVEFAITGFSWNGKVHKMVDSTNGIKGETEMAFKLVKCGSALYLFNQSGQMRAYSDAPDAQMPQSFELGRDSRLRGPQAGRIRRNEYEKVKKLFFV